MTMQQAGIQEFKEMEWFAARVADSGYLLSEQALRSIAAGVCTVHDLEGVLLNGKVLEENKNPLRGPSYLVYGASGGKHLHLVCAADSDNRLVILFAYLPAPPLWPSPTQRKISGGVTMSDRIGHCFFCGGALKEIVAGSYDYRREGQMYVIKRLPASLCEQCGEKYVRAEVGKKVDALVDGQAFSGTETVQVIEYELEKDLLL